jgi:hypothetical protein
VRAAVDEKLKEHQCVISVTCCSLNKFISTNTFELCTRIFVLFLSTLPKIVHSIRNLLSSRKSKQHQLRLMNGGGDDDFNNNNTTTTITTTTTTIDNNRQRKLTISTNSSTASTTAIAQRFQCHNTQNHTLQNILFKFTSKRCVLAFDIGVRTASTWRKLALHLKHVCARNSRFSAIDVESALRSVIGWPSTRCGTSRSIRIATSSRSILRAATTLLLCVGGRCLHSHSCRSHQQSAIQNHNKDGRIVE